MKHNECVDILRGDVGKKIVEQLCRTSPTIRTRYSDIFVRYWCLKEFIVRFDKGLIRPDGRYEQSKRIFDALLLVEPSFSSLAQKWIFKVGFEVKANRRDLLEDNKIQWYLGWTDFFFLAVEDRLVALAMKKARSDPRIGVVSLTTGKIHKMAAWQDVPMGRKCEVMEQAFFRYMQRAELMNSFKIDDFYENSIS